MVIWWPSTSATALGWIREPAPAGRHLRQSLPERFPAVCGFRSEMPGVGARAAAVCLQPEQVPRGLVRIATGAVERIFTPPHMPGNPLSGARYRETLLTSLQASVNPYYHTPTDVRELLFTQMQTLESPSHTLNKLRDFFSLCSWAQASKGRFHIPTAAPLQNPFHTLKPQHAIARITGGQTRRQLR